MSALEKKRPVRDIILVEKAFPNFLCPVGTQYYMLDDCVPNGTLCGCIILITNILSLTGFQIEIKF